MVTIKLWFLTSTLQDNQRMFNQIHRRQELISQLTSLLSDQFIQDEIPEDLRQEAMTIIGLSATPINEKENFNSTQKLSLGKTSKSVSMSKFGARNLTISVEDSPKVKTNKKRGRDLENLERTTEASQKNHVSQKKDKSPKYVRLSASNATTEKHEFECQKIKLALAKVREIEGQKAFLEQKVQELKHLILEERNKIDQTKLASKSIDHQYSSLSKSASSTSHNMITQKRTYQHIQEQQKILAQNFQSSLKQNERILSGIEQEQQLIGMYKVVLEQLKKEVKSQSKQKNAVQQQLMTSKNILEKAKQKYQLLYKKTQNLINKLDRGLEGILGD